MGEKLKEYQQLQNDKQGTGSKIVAAVHRSPVRLSPPSGRTSPSWTDAGPPVLSTSSPAISMIMGPVTPTSDRESPEVTLENIIKGSRVRQAPAVTEIDRQRLETLLEDLELDERYAALEDEDLADTQVESEEEPDSAYMLTSETSMASGYSFITCSPQDVSWNPDTGTESSDEEEYDEEQVFSEQQDWQAALADVTAAKDEEIRLKLAAHEGLKATAAEITRLEQEKAELIRKLSAPVDSRLLCSGIYLQHTTPQPLRNISTCLVLWDRN